MKTRINRTLLAALASCSLVLGVTAETVLNGAGASFPAPVYQIWTYSYSQATPNVRINYQSTGSGAGVNQLKAKTLDFAGTDRPLSDEELKEFGFEQFPMLQGEVVLITSIPGIKDRQLKLDRQTVSNIFLGKITFWNDDVIVKQNKGLKLPRLRITVVRRADSSGTTFIYTTYLSTISKAWRENVGAGATVRWPVGIGGQKNAGVCNTVSKIRGSIGYTEYAYAKQGKFATVTTDDTVVGTTYILTRKDCPTEKRKLLQEYFDWCKVQGVASAIKLGYTPLSAVNQKQEDKKPSPQNATQGLQPTSSGKPLTLTLTLPHPLTLPLPLPLTLSHPLTHPHPQPKEDK